MRIYRAFIIAELKMFYRDRSALFFTIGFPTILMLIFGIMNFDRYNPPDIGIVDNAQNEASGFFIGVLRGDLGGPPLLDVEIFDDEDALDADLLEGGVNVALVIPPEFGTTGGAAPARFDVAYDERQEREAFTAMSLIDDVLDEAFTSAVAIPDDYRRESWVEVSTRSVAGKGQGYKGFLVPGIIGLSIMQSGLFGVVFTLLRFRNQGTLRRLRAAPISALHLLVGVTVTRITVLLMQMYILLLIGSYVLGVEIGPGHPSIWIEMALITIFAGAVFLAMGLAVSGISNNENTAAPVANLISLPMMFLSGAFIPKSVLPDWLLIISEFLPLTFLIDSMRAMVTSGESIFAQGSELLGFALWAVLMFTLAVKAFRWE